MGGVKKAPVIVDTPFLQATTFEHRAPSTEHQTPNAKRQMPNAEINLATGTGYRHLAISEGESETEIGLNKVLY